MPVTVATPISLFDFKCAPFEPPSPAWSSHPRAVRCAACDHAAQVVAYHVCVRARLKPVPAFLFFRLGGGGGGTSPQNVDASSLPPRWGSLRVPSSPTAQACMPIRGIAPPCPPPAGVSSRPPVRRPPGCPPSADGPPHFSARALDVSDLDLVSTPQLFYTCFYNQAHRLRLEKLSCLELSRSSNGIV
jgi:hypothetical protein